MRKRKSIADDMKIVWATAKLARGESLAPKKERKKPVRRKAKNDMREKKLELDIIKSLELCKNVAFVTKAGESATYNSHKCKAGMSDLIVLTDNGRVIFMEVKEGKGDQRGTQIKFEEICNKNGHEYHVVRSVDDAWEIVNGGSK